MSTLSCTTTTESIDWLNLSKVPDVSAMDRSVLLEYNLHLCVRLNYNWELVKTAFIAGPCCCPIGICTHEIFDAKYMEERRDALGFLANRWTTTDSELRDACKVFEQRVRKAERFRLQCLPQLIYHFQEATKEHKALTKAQGHFTKAMQELDEKLVEITKVLG